MDKITKDELRTMFLTKRFDHPGRKTPKEVYRGETAGGVKVSGWNRETNQPIKRTHSFPVEHSFGRPIRGNVALSTVME